MGKVCEESNSKRKALWLEEPTVENDTKTYLHEKIF
jgi:hypothetical protein